MKSSAVDFIYLHLSERHLSATGSPLDSLELKDRPPQNE
jgi:hypothetical protein